MIKFFRHIRKSLLMENKTSKYFKYALGEIILVVIGILIALQINNWNEARKNKNYERSMLAQMKEELQSNSNMLNNWLPSLKGIVRTVNTVAAMKEDPNHPTDSLQYHLERIKGFGIAVSFNTSAYNAINSGGLDKISNPEIRQQISNIYGNTIPSVSKWINEIVRTSLFERNKLFYEIYDPVVVPGKSGIIETKLIETDAQTLRNNPKVDEMLEVLNWPIPISIIVIEELDQKIQNLIEAIDQELK
ncbi:DUF6090 family protein [Winogradskyella sp. MIT101101]|uniref:DUF6090 family protein n=1 Tax=Winogradskyella sp. MIT101101 TaxID=3098297 RepID=UPI00399A8E86